MFVKTPEGEIKFFFKHEAPVWRRNGSRKQRGIAASGVTVCILSFQGRVHVGIARCSTADKYVKAKGREFALARALEQFPKALRELVWEAYEARHEESTEVKVAEVTQLIEAAKGAILGLEEYARVLGNGGVGHSGAGLDSPEFWDPPETGVEVAIPLIPEGHEVVVAPADGPMPEPIPDYFPPF